MAHHGQTETRKPIGGPFALAHKKKRGQIPSNLPASNSGDNERKVYLLGNPNVGKSVIFSLLTKKYATVSNYPGTTVEVTHGRIFTGAGILKQNSVTLIDTPGVNSLIPLSEDEMVTRDILFNHEKTTGEKPRVILVLDAKNIRRGLVLAVQLALFKIPFFIVLNMMDEASSIGIKLDKKKLAHFFGVPVLEAIAIQKVGIPEILALAMSASPWKVPAFETTLPPDIEKIYSQLAAFMPPMLAISVLADDNSIHKYLTKEEMAKAETIRTSHTGSVNLSKIWMENILRVYGAVYFRDMSSGPGWLHRLGRIAMTPVRGTLILLGMLYLVYKFVGVLGAKTGVDFLENTVFNQYINPGINAVFGYLGIGGIFHEIFMGQFGLISMGITYAVAIVLPIVVTFFIAFSFLEDSGYLPRMGALLNNFFTFMGLNGKAVLPMVLGLGCDTMATMTARVMNTHKERIIVTLLLALGVPCSAQMGVVFAFGVFMPAGYMIAWAMSVIGIMLLVGYLASKIIPGKTTLFLMEIPPLRIPSINNILRKTWMRSIWYLKEAVPIFLLGTSILFTMDFFSVLPTLNEALKPVTVHALGLPEESAKSFIMGFLRRDFGAAGLFQMHQEGLMTNRQVLVSLVVITLFVPCIANFLMMIKERGLKIALGMFFFIIPFAFFCGFILNSVMRLLNIG